MENSGFSDIYKPRELSESPWRDQNIEEQGSASPQDNCVVQERKWSVDSGCSNIVESLENAFLRTKPDHRGS